MFEMHLPYHLASSSSAGAATAGFGFAAFFLEKRATGLKVEGVDGVGRDSLPREAAVVDALREAAIMLLLVCYGSSNGIIPRGRVRKRDWRT